MSVATYKEWKCQLLTDEARKEARTIARNNNVQIGRVLREIYEQLKAKGALPEKIDEAAVAPAAILVPEIPAIVAQP